MYVHCVDSGPKGKYRKYLLRSGKRISGKVVNQTLANLSCATSEELAKIESLLKWRRLLRGSSVAKSLDMDIINLVVGVTGLTFQTNLDFSPKTDKRYKPAKIW